MIFCKVFICNEVIVNTIFLFVYFYDFLVFWMYHVLPFYISDRMAENIKEKLEQLEVNEEIVSIQGEVEDTCTVYKHINIYAQMEFTEIKGKYC